MKLRDKIVYGIAGLLAFLPLSALVIIQSVFALEGSYDSKLVIDADKITVGEVIVYDSYNTNITHLVDYEDEEGKPVLYSIIEATGQYVIIDFHGGEIADEEVNVSGLQFKMADGSSTELLRGIVYLQFKNVAMFEEDVDWNRDIWLRDFINDLNELYKVYYEQPQGTIPYIWLKIITASIGTIIGLLTVMLVILRKSTKALVKRYWRIAVLVALIEGTLILGLITWIVADIFQVFAAATVGWLIFLGAEHIAKIKGYLDSSTVTGELPDSLPDEAILAVQSNVEAILAKYRK